MPFLQIEHAVRDYDAWKQAFDSDPIGRERGGVRGHRILRPIGDPNYVLVELDFERAEEAEKFRAALRELWNEAGDRLGLEGAKARIVETVEVG